MMPSISEAASRLQPTTGPPGPHTFPVEPAAHEASLPIHLPESHSAPTPWWLWWNILSLDAPAVACVWALFLLHSNGVDGSAWEILALGIAVWVIYTADRLLDGLAAAGTPLVHARHSFVAKHRVVFGSLMFVAGVILVWLSGGRLERPALRTGLALGAVVALYLISIHAGPARFLKLLPKEIAVGMIFAAGTSIPLWCWPQGLSLRSLAASVLFGLLCSLNCLSIECWERPCHSRDNQEPTPPWIAWADSRLKHIALALVIAAFLFACLLDWRGPARLPMLAISLAAFFILILNQQRKSLSPEALRVFADAALVLPALLALALIHI